MAINPVFVSPIAYPISQYLPYGSIGAFEHASNSWWIVASESASAIGPVNLVAYESTDHGLTWNRIAAGPNILGGDLGSSYWRGAGNNVVLSYRTAGGAGNVFGIIFNMSTRVFGAPFAIPFEPAPDGNYLGGILLEKANGDLALVWQYPTGISIWTVSVAIRSGGVWSAELPVNVATVNKRLKCVVVDGADRVGILSEASPPFQNTYSLTSGITLLSNTFIVNAHLRQGFGLTIDNLGIYDATTDSVVFSTQRITSDPNPPFDDLNTLSLFVGTPSAAPAFSVIDIYSLDETGNSQYLNFPWIVKTSTGYSLFWGHGINFGLFPDGDFEIFRSDATVLAGPWSTPTVVYDLYTNHFPTDPATNNIETMWVTVLSDGTAAVTIGMVQVVAPATNWCGVLGFFSLASGPGTVTLTFNLHGGAGGLELVTVQPPGGGPPGPILTPTECINQ